MYEKIRLVAARIRELNRTEPPSLPESRLPVILSLSPWRKKGREYGKRRRRKKNWMEEKRAERRRRASGHVRQRVYAHLT